MIGVDPCLMKNRGSGAKVFELGGDPAEPIRERGTVVMRSRKKTTTEQCIFDGRVCVASGDVARSWERVVLRQKGFSDKRLHSTVWEAPAARPVSISTRTTRARHPTAAANHQNSSSREDASSRAGSHQNFFYNGGQKINRMREGCWSIHPSTAAAVFRETQRRHGRIRVN